MSSETTRRPTAVHRRAEEAIRKNALGYPETTEDFPWDHSAFKVRGKTFVFVNLDGDSLSVSCKLPESNDAAVTLPFASRTGYGLGKSGWVTASFARGETPPLDLLFEWIDESYRAIAPKRLVKQLP